MSGSEQFYRTPYAYAASFDLAFHFVKRLAYRQTGSPGGWRTGVNPESPALPEPQAGRSRPGLWTALLLVTLLLVAFAAALPLIPMVTGAALLGLVVYAVLRRRASRPSARAGVREPAPDLSPLRAGNGVHVELAVLGLRKGSLRTGSGVLRPLRPDHWDTRPDWHGATPDPPRPAR